MEDVTDLERICTPLIYQGFLTHIDIDNLAFETPPMIVENNVLKFKDRVPGIEAGILTLYSAYSMSDTFVRKSYHIAIGMSQMSVIVNLNFTDNYEYDLIHYESQAYRESVGLVLQGV